MTVKNLNVMYSSKSDEWATPQSFFDEVNREFDFTLDACSTDENHKCDNYFTIADDGLSKNWGGIEYGAIHRIAKYLNGLLNHFMKPGMITQ